MTLKRFSPAVSAEQLSAAIRADGCAIVEGLAAQSLMNQTAQELEPYLQRTPTGSGSFVGQRTRRTSRLIAKSEGCRKLITDPLILTATAQLFAGECYDFQIHATHVSRVDPGEKAQSLHRDDGVFPFRHPSPPSHINTIWALDDFTAENGATRIVLGSHLWDDVRRPEESQCVRAEMPRGSVLIFDAATYHAAAENRSRASRTAVILGYSLGWLRQEENQFLAVPPKLARTLPRRLQELVGYKNHGYLGHFEGSSPSVALQDFVPDVLPAQDLYTPELEQIQLRRR